MDEPRVSVIMPVFNTGKFLSEAIDSVLHQRALESNSLPSFELIVVDDGSTDPETLDILSDKAKDHRVTVLLNRRKKGASGARNTGIEHARGDWIGFLDSDDLWFPHSLSQRWKAVVTEESVKWLAGEFRFLRPIDTEKNEHVFESAQTLLANLVEDTLAPVKRYVRPVREFGEKCMSQTSTVLAQRDLLVQNGMFNENLPRAEDYHLWFQCAFENDLWMIQTDLTFYRIHSASLTHGDTPRYLHEDKMIAELLRHKNGRKHAEILIRRLDLVMQDHCYFYRARGLFRSAVSFSFRWIRKRPLNPSAWKELIACSLRAG